MSRKLLLLVILAAPLGSNPPAGGCESELCNLVASGSLAELRWPDFSAYRAQVQNFYEPRAYALAWVGPASATEQAKSLIQILANASAKGLDPQDYSGPAAAEANPARFDLALTVSVMRYISDLHIGKANPGLFHGPFDLGGGEHGLADFVRERLIDATDVKAALDGVEPPYEGYRRALQALQRYLAISREPDLGPLPATKGVIEPGSSYIAAARLASLLRRLGDLPADTALPSDPTTYAEPLVSAVKHFQTRHGLDPDGRIGKATLAQLNTPLSDRVRQLQLTLERWRWVPHSFPRPPIVVNVPEFQLRALNDAYQTELEMKVVVGAAYHHQTPMFAADMKYVVFRPYWDVPRSILRAELLPKVERDRSYFIEHSYEVVTINGVVVSDGTVDDEILAGLRAGSLRVRQVPGAENALGLVKFVVPNEHDVYLHATPATELFARSRRDFSHGCIRAEKPAELAAWVLRDKPEWTPERIRDAMNGAETLEVAIGRPIPVLIVYSTAVALNNGEVRFFDDIYGQDAQLAQLLAQGYPYNGWKATSAGPGQHPRE